MRYPGLPVGSQVKAAFVRLAHVYFGALEVSDLSLGVEPVTNNLDSVGLLGKEIRVSNRLSETEFAVIIEAVIIEARFQIQRVEELLSRIELLRISQQAHSRE